jgi:aminopeptidase
VSDRLFRSGDSRRELTHAAGVLLERLGVSDADRFLVVCNPAEADQVGLVDSVVAAARLRAARVDVCEYPVGTRDGEQPPDEVAVALRSATAAALLTRFSISHTQARLQATRAGARIASLPGISREVFTRALPTDYEQLQQSGRALAEQLSAATRCHVRGPAGTDVLLSLHGRTAICDDGDLREPGAFGNLPAGEAYIAPLESDASGRIVFDGSLSEWGLLDQPLTVVIERGRAVSASGGEVARWLLETLDAGGPNGRVLAELGIGTNPRATVSGFVLEDEKANETAHFAFGTNTGMGGANEAAVHIDALVLRPRIELDGGTIIHNGLSVSRSG